jgi:hypothetical protein
MTVLFRVKAIGVMQFVDIREMVNVVKRSLILPLMLCVMFAAGCGKTASEPEDGRASEPSETEEADPATAANIALSDRVKRQLTLSELEITMPLAWDAPPWADAYPHETLGITALEACAEQNYQYYWKPDGREAVEDIEGRWTRFHFFIFKLPASDDGKRLLPNGIVSLQSKGAEVFHGLPYSDSQRDEPLLPTLRVGSKWESINRYAAEVGVLKEEITTRKELVGPEENRFGYNVYRDVFTGDEYSFDSDNQCDFIYLTVDKVFSDIKMEMPGAEFIETMNLRVDWSVDSALYAYIFEDCTVYIFTDIDRNISRNKDVIFKQTDVFPDKTQ